MKEILNRLLILITICIICQSAAAISFAHRFEYDEDQIVWFDCYDDRMVYCWETGEVFELELDTGKTKFLFRVGVIGPWQRLYLSQAKQKILAIGDAPISFYDINTQKRTQCQIDDIEFMGGLGFLGSTNHYVCRGSKKIWVVDAVDCKVLASFDYSDEISGLIKLSKDGDKYIYSCDGSTFTKGGTGEVHWYKVYSSLRADAYEDQPGRYDVIVFSKYVRNDVSKIFTFDTFKEKDIWTKKRVSHDPLRAVSRDAKRLLFRSKDKLAIENVPLNNRVFVDTRISEVDAVFAVNGDLLLLPEVKYYESINEKYLTLKKRENNILTIVDSATGKVKQQWNLKKINTQEGQLMPLGKIPRKTFYLLLSVSLILSLILFIFIRKNKGVR